MAKALYLITVSDGKPEKAIHLQLPANYDFERSLFTISPEDMGRAANEDPKKRELLSRLHPNFRTEPFTPALNLITRRPVRLR